PGFHMDAASRAYTDGGTFHFAFSRCRGVAGAGSRRRLFRHPAPWGQVTPAMGVRYVATAAGVSTVTRGTRPDVDEGAPKERYAAAWQSNAIRRKARGAPRVGIETRMSG